MWTILTAGCFEAQFLGAGPVRVLKQLRNEGTPLALQATRPSRGSDDHVKWRSRLQWEK